MDEHFCPSIFRQILPKLCLYEFLYLYFQDGDKLIRLWIHEIYRVFYDRLVDEEDRKVFFHMVEETTSNNFKQSLDKVFFSNVLGLRMRLIYFQKYLNVEIALVLDTFCIISIIAFIEFGWSYICIMYYTYPYAN